MTKFNDERKNLILLTASCESVIQLCSQILMSKVDDINPQLQKTNRQLLEVELGSVQAMIGILIQSQIVHPPRISQTRVEGAKRTGERI